MRHLRPGAGRQLVCIPFAGGASHVYAPLAAAMPEGWDVVALDAPGHGARSGPFAPDFEALVAAYAESLAAVARPGHILFGHSLGGLVAYRLAQRHPPGALVLSACVPSGRPDGPTSTAPDAALIAFLERTGATAPELLADREFVAYLLDMLRADLRAAETFHDSAIGALALPVLLLSGRHDEEAGPAAAEAWRTRAPHATATVIDGGHMFVVANPAAVADAIAAFAATLSATRRSPSPRPAAR